ncbi:hypothetical protein M8J75_011737 [Diaphorina citri]|nr:hypothetical protein M8J75_011737 [Diaphorina citri]
MDNNGVHKIQEMTTPSLVKEGPAHVQQSTSTDQHPKQYRRYSISPNLVFMKQSVDFLCGLSLETSWSPGNATGQARHVHPVAKCPLGFVLVIRVCHCHAGEFKITVGFAPAFIAVRLMYSPVAARGQMKR